MILGQSDYIKPDGKLSFYYEDHCMKLERKQRELRAKVDQVMA
jgi:hypothetical protein